MMGRTCVFLDLVRCLLTLLLLASVPVPAGAALTGDVLADSEIVLVEQGGHVRPNSITIATKDGSTTVTAIKDGTEVRGTMSPDACRELWNYLLLHGIESMRDTQPPVVPPGQPEFTLTFRVGATSHSFSVIGVDFLQDSRYRDVVRKILEASGT